eukprot:gene11770-5108_t
MGQKMFSEVQKDQRVKNLVSAEFASNSDFKIHQWVNKVLNFSSEYQGWPATNVVDKPMTYPNYGDITTAWAPLKSKNNKEYLELEYPIPVHVLSLNVYETYNPGSLVKVSTKEIGGNVWDVIWEGEKEHQKIPEESRIKSIDCRQDSYETNVIRLDFDTYGARSWSEIDAVQLIGYIYDKRKLFVFQRMLKNKKDLNINFFFL